MIVWERDGRWAAWARQSCAELLTPLTAVRSAESCWNAYIEDPAQPVWIEFRPDRWRVSLECVRRLSGWGPGPKCILGAGPRWLESAAPALHEAGVIWTVTSPRQLPRLAELVRRHREWISSGGYRHGVGPRK